MCIDPSEQSSECSHDGSMEILLVLRVFLAGLVMDVLTYPLHSIPAISVVCSKQNR